MNQTKHHNIKNHLTRINTRNRISLDLDHLNHTSNLPNASVRKIKTVFPLPSMTYSLDIPSWTYSLSTWNYSVPSWTYHLHLIYGQTFAMMKPDDLEHKRRHGPEKEWKARRRKFMKVYYKKIYEILRL